MYRFRWFALGLLLGCVFGLCAGLNFVSPDTATSKAEAIETYQAEHGPPKYGVPLGTMEPGPKDNLYNGPKTNELMPPLRFIEWFRRNE